VVVAVDPATLVEYDTILESDEWLRVTATRMDGGVGGQAVASLTFALCKGKHNDLVCEKATELGVGRIIFWCAERSVVRVGSREEGQHKVARWRKIAESAAAQCGRRDIPEIHLVTDPPALIEGLTTYAPPNHRRFCCSLGPEALPLRKVQPLLSPSHLVIGPEGALTTAEEEMFVGLGFERITLGPLRLRSETAAITAISMVSVLREF
jgi:16S rRNA (uracil1498-N3)-methyltransferase